MKLKWLIILFVLLLATYSSGVLVVPNVDPTKLPLAGGNIDALDINSIDIAGDVNVVGTGTFGDLIVDGNTLVVDNVNHRVGIGTASDMLAPLGITGDTTSIEDRHEGIWIRGKTGAYIVQINVRGSRLEIGGGATLDTTPAMSVDYLTSDVNIGGTFTVGDATNRTLIDPNGVMTMEGGARVIGSISVDNANLGKGANAPTQVIVGNYNVWEYDIGDDTVFTFHIPHEWDDGTDIDIHFDWQVDEAYATNGAEVNWQIVWISTSHDETEAIDGGGATLSTGDINIPATARFLRSDIITLPGGGLADEDQVGITLTRITVVDGNDTNAANDAGLVDIHIEYIKDKPGKAI